MEKFVSFIRIHHFVLSCLALFLFAGVIFTFIQRTQGFPDPDSFYHAGMARLIRQEGVMRDFRWLPYTSLGEHYTDHHLLYHILLAPFMGGGQPLRALQVATVILGALFILTFALVLCSLGVRGAFWYGALLVGCNAFIFRLNLAKASALSLIIFFLGLWALCKGYRALVLLISFFYVWAYGGWILLPVAAAGLVMAGIVEYFVVQKDLKRNTMFERVLRPFWHGWRRCEEPTSWLRTADTGIAICQRHGNTQDSHAMSENIVLLFKSFCTNSSLHLLIAALAGSGLGLLLNPYFPDNLYFYWQQIVDIGIINYQSRIGVGSEWYPYPLLDLIKDTQPLFIFLAVGLLLFAVRLDKQRRQGWLLALLLALVTFAVLKSRRYVEYFVPVALMFSAYAISFFAATNPRGALSEHWKALGKNLREENVFQLVLVIFFAASIPVMFVTSIRQVERYYHDTHAYTEFAGASFWLARNTPDNSIVFHSDWDEFPILFYHNPHNRYISGLDPTFMYKHDAGLYQKYVDITLGEETEHLYEWIKNDFVAEYVFIDTTHEAMKKNIDNNFHFTLVYEDAEASVYRVQ